MKHLPDTLRTDRSKYLVSRKRQVPCLLFVHGLYPLVTGYMIGFVEQAPNSEQACIRPQTSTPHRYMIRDEDEPNNQIREMRSHPNENATLSRSDKSVNNMFKHSNRSALRTDDTPGKVDKN